MWPCADRIGYEALGRLDAYGANSPYLNNTNGGGYEYTQAYFDAGGKVFTAPVSGRNVLSDTRDFANSDNLLWFADLVSHRAVDLPLSSQTLVDWVKTDKLSTYGYASRTRQFVFEEKLTAKHSFALLKGLDVQAGASARYTDATLLQDYSLEPFSRRDISRPEVSNNSVLLTGEQKGPDGLNYWSPTTIGGANISSRLWQLSLFASTETRVCERFTVHLAGRVAHAPFRTWYPEEVDRASAADRSALATRDHKNYGSISASPVLRLAEGLNAYATIQRGTSLDATQGGAIFGRGNFSRSDLDESGLKYSLPRYHLSSGLSFFRWTQDQFDVRTVSPELMRGRGWEYELSFAPTEKLSFTASTGWQRVRRFKDLTAIRSMPLSEQQWALFGGVMNNSFGPAYFKPSDGRRPPANTALVYPGSPETQYKFNARWRVTQGLVLSGGPVISDAYWQNFDHSLRLPRSAVWNFHAEQTLGAWALSAALNNAFNETYFYGSEPIFGANTLLTKAPGTEYRLTLTLHF